MSQIKLKPHQQNVVNYMKETDSRGIILYHGLGSGKTITSIAISQIYPDKKVFVLVPAPLRSQWKVELEKMKVKMENYTVISYEGFVKEIKNKPNMLDDNIVILDEFSSC